MQAHALPARENCRQGQSANAPLQLLARMQTDEKQLANYRTARLVPRETSEIASAEK